jgi:cytochrome c-type biogenesis protein CcmE
MTKGTQLALGATAIALLLAWYAVSNFAGGVSYQYYQTLDEFHAAAAAARGRSLRVHGYVASDSIHRDLEGRKVHFAVQNSPPHAGGPQGTLLSVVYRNLDTPDLFKDGAEVVVEGRLEGPDQELVFVADNVLAKCPSKFEARVGTERADDATL